MVFGDGAFGGIITMRLVLGRVGGSEMVSGAHKRKTGLRWLICFVRISHCVMFKKTPAWH